MAGHAMKPRRLLGASCAVSFAWASAAASADGAAPNAGMNQVSVGAQRDASHNREALATVGLAIGERAWARAGAGAARSEQAGATRRPTLANAAAGWIGDGWAVGGALAQRRDGARYKQGDSALALEWRPSGGALGVDLAQRRTHAEGTVATITSSGGTAFVPVAESLSSSGVGLHGTLRVGERLELSAAAMRHHVSATSSQAGSASTVGNVIDLPGAIGGVLANQPLLTRTLLAGTSAVNRHEAALDRSARVGIAYRLAHATLSAEYLVDRVHEAGDTLRSLQAKAAIGIATHWTVTPLLGHSHSAQAGGVNYGGLTVGYGW
jgi:hypothetical protein